MTDELLIKFLLNECTGAEESEVREWRSHSAANEEHYVQFQKIWEAGKVLGRGSGADENAAWLRFRKRAAPAPRKVVKMNAVSIWMKVAAVVLVAVGAWSAYNLLGPDTYKAIDAGGRVFTQALPDGSQLTLNKFSQLSYARNFRNHRSIKFKTGEVFFEVAKDKKNPFVIDIEDVAVEVVGTSFNIRHLNNETEVNVESGIVKVRVRGQEIRLYKGEKILIGSGAGPLVKQAVTDQLYNYYLTNLFIANGTPLWKLVSVLNEAYGSKVILDPKVNDLIINTTLKTGELDRNLQIICETLNLKQSRNGEGILLSY